MCGNPSDASVAGNRKGLPFHSRLRLSAVSGLAAHNYERKRYMPEHVPCPNTRRGRVNHVHPPFSERRRKTCWNKKKKASKQQKKAAISSTGCELSASPRTRALSQTASHFVLTTTRISHNSGTAEDLDFKAGYRDKSRPQRRIPNQS